MNETMPTPDDEQLLMDVLNSTPVVDGELTDLLADGHELAAAREVRDDLQRVVRGVAPASALNPYLVGVTRVPEIGDDGLHWRLDVADDRELPARLVLAWAATDSGLPGALRPCANDECHLFLLDHSRAGTARWCSMSTCGNRMKARRHRARTSTD